jgi:hypothetical protein
VENLVTKISECDFVDYIKSFDLFCALETFLGENFDFGIHFKEFHVFNSPAVKLSKHGRRSGGVALFVKKEIMQYVSQVHCPFDNMICVKIDKQFIGLDRDLLFVFVYIPPYQSPFYKDSDVKCHIHNVEEFLLNLYEKGESSYLLLGGDFNARIGSYDFDTDDDDLVFHKNDNSCGRKSLDKVTNIFGKAFISFCNLFDCLPLNGFHSGDTEGNFTFVAEQGNSVVDYFVVCRDVMLKCDMLFEVARRVESSHMPLHLTLTRNVKPDSNYIKLDEGPTRQSFEKFKWDDENKEEFVEKINSEDTKTNLQTAYDLIDTDPDLAVNKLNESLLNAGQCMRKTIWLDTATPRASNRWFDRDCRASKREARRALHTFQNSRSQADKETYQRKRAQYKSVIKEKKKGFKVSMHQELFSNKGNSNKFWKTVRNARQKKKQQPNIAINAWQEHFEEVLGTHLEQTESPSNYEDTNRYIPQLDDEIRENEIHDAIKNLKCGKASGLDNIEGEFLKHAGNSISPFLTKLFNKIYSVGQFPKEWCKSVIVPIFKNGDEKNPTNYRGISLLSIISKVFTQILNKRLYTWAENEGKISNEQAGFRKGYSTIDHIFTLTSIINEKLNSKRGGKVYAAFVDYRKAFDTVNHSKLWTVLEKLQTSSKMITILKSMYTGAQCCVRWGVKVSDFFGCPQGVKQGCLLSPLIFSLFISEVADHVRKHGKHGFQLFPGFEEIFLLMFADDIVLLSSTPTGLQNQISSLEVASKSLGLTVNMNKTKIMVFRKGGHIASKEKWWYDGNVIEIVNSYKYLGYVLTTKLSSDGACQLYVSKAKGKVLELMKTMWALGSLDSSLFFQLFDAQVKPMLLYASEIWGTVRLSIVESAHLFACKRLLSLSDKTPNQLVYGDTGRYPLFIESTLSALRYWLKIKNMPIERFPKQALMKMQSTLERDGYESMKNWACRIKICLDTYGYSDVWTNGVVNVNAFIRSFKQSMIDKFRSDWATKLESSDRFSTYRMFKETHKAETYLNDVTIKRFRDSVIRLRLGINELKINSRFSLANVDKSCPFCPGTMEDESHFLLSCPVYKNLRERYIQEFLIHDLNSDLKLLLQMSSVNLARRIGMFTFYALKRREELIHN